MRNENFVNTITKINKLLCNLAIDKLNIHFAFDIAFNLTSDVTTVLQHGLKFVVKNLYRKLWI